MNRLLLCTDLDRTLIPNGSQPESAGARELFARLVGLRGVRLAYVSGRHRALIEQAMQEYDLPRPDFAIADVGSTIYRLSGSRWRQWRQWDSEIAGDWQGMSAEKLHGMLADIPPLQLQEREKQNRHKLSYYLPPGAHRETLAEVERRLRQRHIRANLIRSVDTERQTGLLDILPAAANKLHAIRFLMRHHGFDMEHTVFAGDSGNDLDVLLSPVRAILVANADSEVRAAARQAREEQYLYLARGGFLGMNGCYSAGILEGVAHYRPELAPLIAGLRQP